MRYFKKFKGIASNLHVHVAQSQEQWLIKSEGHGCDSC